MWRLDEVKPVARPYIPFLYIGCNVYGEPTNWAREYRYHVRLFKSIASEPSQVALSLMQIRFDRVAWLA